MMELLLSFLDVSQTPPGSESWLGRPQSHWSGCWPRAALFLLPARNNVTFIQWRQKHFFFPTLLLQRYSQPQCYDDDLFDKKCANCFHRRSFLVLRRTSDAVVAWEAGAGWRLELYERVSTTFFTHYVAMLSGTASFKYFSFSFMVTSVQII